MASIWEGIAKLTDQQLRTRLQRFGETIGPIVPSLRPLFENRLARYITGKSAEKSEADSQAAKATNSTVTADTDSDRSGSSRTSDVKFEIGAPEPEDVQESTTSQPAVYYGVAVPEGTDLSELDPRPDELVFTDKTQALKIAKKLRGSRFKSFPTYEEAYAFSKTIPAAPTLMLSPGSKPSEKNKSVLVDTMGMAVESSNFKGPRIQELVKLRKAIERGDIDAVHKLSWSNPRYLISSGDTPTILQEGFRYNSLHVGATKDQAEIVGMIIDTLEDQRFMELLYPQDTPESRLNRIDFIVDLYLNTPDKGNCETPLHFACKFGNIEVVSILAAHPKTDKTRKNKYGELASDVVCSRVRTQSRDIEQQILDLLDDQCYVPLLRPPDNSMQPVIGEPWSPDVMNSQSQIVPGSPVPSSPKDPTFEVKAYAGPMSPSQAAVFRSKWSTPPRGKAEDKQRYHQLRRGDNDKGMEQIGRIIAKEMNIKWCEHWSFLDAFADLSSDKGLHRLENFLKKRSQSKADETVLESSSYGSDSVLLPETSSEQDLNESADGIDLIADKFGSLTIHSPGSPAPHTKPEFGVSSTDSGDNNVIKEAYGGALIGGSPCTVDNVKPSNSKSNVDSGSVCDNKTAGNVPRDTKCNTDDADVEAKGSDASNNDAGKSIDAVAKKEEGESNINDGKIKTSATEEAKVCDTGHDDTKGEGGKQTSSSNKDSDIRQDVNSEEAIVKIGLKKSNNAVGKSDSSLSEESGSHSKVQSEPLLDLSVTAKDTSQVSGIGTPGRAAPSIRFDLQTPKLPGRGVTFITGLHPTKVDMDVLLAIHDVMVSPDQFPHVAKWQELVLSYPKAARNSWPSPAVLQRRMGRVPRRAGHLQPHIRPSPLAGISLQDNVNVQTSSSKPNKMGDVQANLLDRFLGTDH